MKLALFALLVICSSSVLADFGVDMQFELDGRVDLDGNRIDRFDRIDRDRRPDDSCHHEEGCYCKDGRQGQDGEHGHHGHQLKRPFGQVYGTKLQTIPTPASAAGNFITFDSNGHHEDVHHFPGKAAVFVEHGGAYLLTAALLIQVKSVATCTLYVDGLPLSGAQYSFAPPAQRTLTTIVPLKARSKVELFCTGPSQLPASVVPNANLILARL